MSAPRIGVLALQGAFREHIQAVQQCGGAPVAIRTIQDMEGLRGLILPGGESTVMGKLLTEWNLMDPVRAFCQSGAPVFGTCAGLILLCKDIAGYPDQPRIGVLDAVVRRNAFGRQVDSFTTELALPSVLGKDPLPAVFIRAPLIESVGPGVEVLARVNELPVAVRQNNILGISFHPELTPDVRLHQWVVQQAKAAFS